ncbi:MAG: hypothetical protein LBV52_02315, partial [Spirochaetaceae bacterium]|nr:hypothetical protein [Spirochaetaceae bacterium]
APVAKPAVPVKTIISTGLWIRRVSVPAGTVRIDIQTLREMIYKVDEHIYSGNPISEEELKAMEALITKLKLHYGVFSKAP